jgi:hypothetical protein
MGETSKENKHHQIGGHGIFSIYKLTPGEGMKVGIIALLRENVKVFYFTNREIWNWKFAYSKLGKHILAVDAQWYAPRKVKDDTTIKFEAIRQGRRKANKDTTVILLGINETDVVFSDYLFLRSPAPETVFNTQHGSLLMADEHRRKVFVKGIFVEERTNDDPPPLFYGVNFTTAVLDRDRRNLMTGKAVASTLAMMWDEVLVKDPPGMAAKYLELLLENQDDRFLEVSHASRHITLSSATKLHRELCVRFPGKFFFCSENADATEVPLS